MAFIFSLNTITPAKILVTGSKVLKTDALLPPMRNVPLWKRTTAPTFNDKANKVVNNQPEIETGHLCWLVKRHTINMRTYENVAT